MTAKTATPTRSPHSTPPNQAFSHMNSHISSRNRSRWTSLPLCLVAVLAANGLTSCTSGPYATNLMVVGGEDLNKTFNDKPSAVNLRILQLKKKDVFESATDAELRSPKLKEATWHESYSEAKVRVGKTREIEITIQPEVLFLGIVGLFNEKEGNWRAVIDVGSLSSDKLVFDKYAFSKEPREQ